jgi:branched-subunit amino acid ABC-type transport system permease component
VGTGALYAAFAIGMVLTYRGSGVVNFAQVAMSTYVAMAFVELREHGDLIVPLLPVRYRIDLGSSLPFGVAFVLALSIAALVGAVVERLVFRQLRQAGSVAKIVASVGVSAAIVGLINVQFADARGVVAVRRTGPILPNGSVRLFGTNVSVDRFLLLAMVVVVGFGLSAVYRWTRFGLTARAAAEDAKGAELLGISPSAVSSWSWIVASVLSAAGAIMATPVLGASLTTLGVYVAYGLAAALAARFRSFGVATAVGIGLGMFESLAVKLKSESWMPAVLKGGFESAAPFVVILVVLVIGGSTLPSRGALVEHRNPRAPMSARNPWVAVLLVGAAAWVLTFGAGRFRLAMTETMIVTVLGLAVVMMAGFIGQITLAEFTFAGIAAYALARLADVDHIGFPWSPLLAIAITTAVAGLLTYPAVRIRGLQLAIVTYTGSLALVAVVFRNPKLTGMGTVVSVPPPSVFGAGFGPSSSRPGQPDGFPYKPFGLFVLAVCMACTLLVVNVRRSSLGRRMLAVRSNERAAAALGVNVPRTKVLGASIAGFLASCAGVLWAYKYIQFNSASFAVERSLDYVALVYIAGISMVSGAFIAGLLTGGGIFFAVVNGGRQPSWINLALGIGMIAVALRFEGGLASLGPALRRRMMLWRMGATPSRRWSAVKPEADAVQGS